MGKREMSEAEVAAWRGGLEVEIGDVKRMIRDCEDGIAVIEGIMRRFSKRMIRQCDDAIAVMEAILRGLSKGNGGDGL
jgi:hypothetical protein